jgi:ATP-binding cassette subfamily F protein uup
MNYLSAENISKAFSDRWLFRNVTFGIGKGEKVALVGANGSGKSTLLNVLASVLPPDEGRVSLRKEISIGFLGQSPAFDEEKTILDTLFSSGHPALKAIRSYEAALAHPENTAALERAITEMDATKAWDYETQVKQILGKLGIQDLERRVKMLSGGQRKRVALARVLIEEPDLLILDEPTNHLDLDAIEWLEGRLAASTQTLILVTHDRYFLDRVTTDIVELSAAGLQRYKGNYSYFLEKKAELTASQAAETEKARNLLRKELDWMRRQPKARGTKAKYRVDAFYELQDKAKGPGSDGKLELSVKTTRVGNKILELDGINKSFGEQPIVTNFSYTFLRGDRLGIVGKNGVGKTTFLNMITGKLLPNAGKIDKGDTITFGYYTQDELTFQEGQRVIDIVQEIAEVVPMANGQTVTASQFLQLFRFPPPVQYSPVSKLSGGERRRLQLLKVLIKNPNFLILDEPTNDLDLDTINVLEDFLENFPGCLIIVSHDRYFMDRLVEHLFVFEGEGRIKDFPGNYTDYREELAEEEARRKEQAAKAAAPVAKAAPATADKKRLSFKEKQEYERLEAEIDGLETRKKELVGKLNAGSAKHEELTGWAREIEQIEAEIDKKSDRWLELGEYL